jgi:hypothetical protein
MHHNRRPEASLLNVLQERPRLRLDPGFVGMERRWDDERAPRLDMEEYEQI